jgi:hypothetical protein
MTIDDCIPGIAVRYVPFHAGSDYQHPDCEDGEVVRINDDRTHAFVKFNPAHTYGVACRPDTLVPLPLPDIAPRPPEPVEAPPVEPSAAAPAPKPAPRSKIPVDDRTPDLFGDA